LRLENLWNYRLLLCILTSLLRLLSYRTPDVD
jgi:hypothetical protein